MTNVYWALSDTWEVFKRHVVRIRSTPGELVGYVIMQPLLLIVLFRYVFGGAVATGGPDYADFLTPGIFATSGILVATVAAVSVANDVSSGIVDRFRSLPMTKSAILGGAILANAFRACLAIPPMVLIGVLVGFRPDTDVGRWLAAIALLVLVSYAFSWLLALLGLLAGTVEGAQQMGMFIWPLTFVSSAFVPAESLPDGLEAFASNQPITEAIEAIRALMLGQPVGDHAWITVVWCLGIIAVSVALSGLLFRRKVQ